MAEKIGTWGDRIGVRLVGHFPIRQVDIAPARPIVSFSFDDAPATAGREGASIVESADGRATFYLSGGLMRDASREGEMVTAEHARELHARGHEIGCHSFAHRKLGGFSREELRADLRINDSILRDIDGREEPRNFAVPYTMATPGTQGELRQRYLTSRGGWRGVNRGPTDPHFLKAFELREERLGEPAMLEAVRSLQDAPGWMIFFTHDIAEKPGMFGCSISGFARLVEMVANLGYQIATVDEALEITGARTELMRRLGHIGGTPLSARSGERPAVAARLAKTLVAG